MVSNIFSREVEACKSKIFSLSFVLSLLHSNADRIAVSKFEHEKGMNLLQSLIIRYFFFLLPYHFFNKNRNDFLVALLLLLLLLQQQYYSSRLTFNWN
jgi:cell division protein FtsW (lipid II flippase)